MLAFGDPNCQHNRSCHDAGFLNLVFCWSLHQWQILLLHHHQDVRSSFHYVPQKQVDCWDSWWLPLNSSSTRWSSTLNFYSLFQEWSSSTLCTPFANIASHRSWPSNSAPSKSQRNVFSTQPTNNNSLPIPNSSHNHDNIRNPKTPRRIRSPHPIIRLILI